ncbi:MULTISPECIES: hypothetical protein [Francisella]|uniref:hypothetical protein n=1 Tax=Francisella TaxID=262 RepID=UPI0008FCDF08|nr:MULTISPECIES: hypothetical protein [Francisella]AXH32294.1 hypothetical protein CGC44_08730 [Francisella opportunistica]AXH33943.1 hypothetical protein CGC45_08790 [Francisella opportunistica]
MLETGKHRNSKEDCLANIRNKLYIICYLPGFLSSVIADDKFINWYSDKVKSNKLLENKYIKNIYNSHEKYIKDFIDPDIVNILKQSFSSIKPNYIPVVFRYGAFASTTALIRSNANVANRMEFELYDSPERLHNQYSEKEKSIMPKSVSKAKDHSIDNGMSLFSLNLTNKNDNGLRKAILKLAQSYNLDFKVGISGNLDQAMTQALLLGMATTKKGDSKVLDEDQLLYMTYLYCIFMAHSVDHTVDEILMSANTYLFNSKEEKYPILSIDKFFSKPVFQLSNDKRFETLAKRYQESLKPTSENLRNPYINRITTLSNIYEDIYNLNCLYSSLSESCLYDLLSTHSENHATLLEQYSRKKKAEIGGGKKAEEINYNAYNEMNQYKCNYHAKTKSTGLPITTYTPSHEAQINQDYSLYSSEKDKLSYLKYNFKDNKFDAVYKIKHKKKKNENGIIYAKKQNTRYCYGYFNYNFAVSRITTLYRIKDKFGNYLVNLHDNKYSFATPHSDSKIYRISPELLNNKEDFTKVSEDIITSYYYLNFDKQK